MVQKYYLCTRLTQGEVLEWLKRHAWKACSRQNWLAGSNPVLSASNPKVSEDSKLLGKTSEVNPKACLEDSKLLDKTRRFLNVTGL